ncbi:hypothetical protein [Olleya marilimosa]|uniref:hypothetical protein n=1 Tax=Olleya marilimosa TaxID=272164 RepID=UPI0030EBA63D|tara:strand:- start:87936 stop:88373 length:438 start_codon:yes stop_codon:yes gene_type:complete
MKEELRRLRAEKAADKERFEVLSIRVNNMLKIFNEDAGETMVTWEDLLDTKVGEIYYVNENVYFIPVNIQSKKLTFISICEPNGKFGIQEHDIDEACKVIKGQLIEKMQDNRVIKKGETITYKAHQKHKPVGGDEFNIYWVEFKK